MRVLARALSLAVVVAHANQFKTYPRRTTAIRSVASVLRVSPRVASRAPWDTPLLLFTACHGWQYVLPMVHSVRVRVHSHVGMDSRVGARPLVRLTRTQEANHAQPHFATRPKVLRPSTPCGSLFIRKVFFPACPQAEWVAPRGPTPLALFADYYRENGRNYTFFSIPPLQRCTREFLVFFLR